MAWLLENMFGKGASGAAALQAQQAQEYGASWSWPVGMVASSMTTMMGPDRQHVVVHHVIDKPRPNTCTQCGAPPERHSPDCSYCGADDMFA